MPTCQGGFSGETLRAAKKSRGKGNYENAEYWEGPDGKRRRQTRRCRPPGHSVKLTLQRKITVYGWLHPQGDDWR
jgi:hypothetical protein